MVVLWFYACSAAMPRLPQMVDFRLRREPVQVLVHELHGKNAVNNETFCQVVESSGNSCYILSCNPSTRSLQSISNPFEKKPCIRKKKKACLHQKNPASHWPGMPGPVRPTGARVIPGPGSGFRNFVNGFHSTCVYTIRIYTYISLSTQLINPSFHFTFHVLFRLIVHHRGHYR